VSVEVASAIDTAEARHDMRSKLLGNHEVAGVRRRLDLARQFDVALLELPSDRWRELLVAAYVCH